MCKNLRNLFKRAYLVERAGFEPAKVKPPDLQSGPVGRLGNLSFDEVVIVSKKTTFVKLILYLFSPHRQVTT